MREQKKDLELTRRNFLYRSGLGIAGVSLAGMPNLIYGAEEKPKYGGTLRVVYRYASSGLDVHRNQEFMDMQNYCLMYGGLLEQGKLPQMEMYPMLAKSWEVSPDGREFIFPLRQGVKFHHGKEFDSGDVKYSIERVMNPATRSPRAFAFKWIDSIQIIDKYTIKITLKEPFGPFLNSLTIFTCAIIPAGWQPTPTKPAPGTGPFVFKSMVPNETLEVARWDQYYEADEKTGDRLPYLGGVFVKKVVDETVRMTALRAGDVDAVSGPPASVLSQALSEKPIPGIVMGYDRPGSTVIFFNVTKPPFNNKKVRQAIAYALDKEEMNKAIFWGFGEPLNSQPFVKGSRFRIPVKEREVNLAKAKQLLAEAGYPNGFKTEFFEFATASVREGAQSAMGQLRRIGIEATMNMIDQAPYFAAMRKGEYSISCSGISSRYDWDDAYYLYLHSGEIGKNNWSRYSNKELDALLEKGRTTWKYEERIPIYKKVVETIEEDLPIWYGLQSTVGYAFRDSLKGFREGFGLRFAWHGGGAKYWWLAK